MNLIIAFFLGLFVAILIWFISEISEIEIKDIDEIAAKRIELERKQRKLF